MAKQLQQIGTNKLFTFHEGLAKREDMVLLVDGKHVANPYSRANDPVKQEVSAETISQIERLKAEVSELKNSDEVIARLTRENEQLQVQVQELETLLSNQAASSAEVSPTQIAAESEIISKDDDLDLGVLDDLR